MARTGLKGHDIVLTMTFYDNGSLYDPFDIQDVEIYDQQVGGNLLATITPVQVSTGVYTATWSIPSNQASNTYWDQWTYTAISPQLPAEVFRANFIVSGDVSLVAGGNTQTLENRLRIIEKAINDIAVALNNVPTKKQVNAWQVLFQKSLTELQQEIETHEAVGH